MMVYSRGDPANSDFVGSIYNWVLVKSGTIASPTTALHIVTADYAYFDNSTPG